MLTPRKKIEQSDVLICGVPGDSFKLPTKLLREGAMCINFSTEKVCGFPIKRKCTRTDLDDKNFEDDVKDKASIYVPAIGKVTIVMLLRNLLVSEYSKCTYPVQANTTQRLVQNRELRMDIDISEALTT